MPLISVIMPAYNAELYIKEAMESILNQTLTDFEFLIYNDGSKDKTDEIICSFNDPRIVYKKNENNLGYLNLLNDGLENAKGKYIARMDADDISMPNRLEIQFMYLEEHFDVGICGTWYEFFGMLSSIHKSPVTFEEIQYQLFFGCPLTHPSVMMRHDFISKHHLRYRYEYYYAEDHYFFAEGSFNFKITNIPLVLLKYRIHDLQIGTVKWKEQFIAKSKIQAKLFSNILITKNNCDVEWLENFFMEKSIPSEKWLNEIKDYKTRIIKSNQMQLVYSKPLLDKAVNNLFKSKTDRNFYKYYYNKYYNRKTYSPILLLSFLKEKHKPYVFLGRKLTIYFIVKCLILYKKKSILVQ